MAGELRLAPRPGIAGTGPRGADSQRRTIRHGQTAALSGCEHRTVAKDGRILCAKIVEGDP
ncbi:MAG: hypothetical protein ACP5JJ_09335, partial [Anaerolineae bacterium]